MMKINRFSGKYRFLSNFFFSPVAYEGLNYTTSEHAFQAAKSLDTQIREKIRTIKSPADAKKYARTIHRRHDWEEIKVDVMTDIVRIKFHTNPELAKQLWETGNTELIEGNYWCDDFWGICVCLKHRSQGSNHLGKILMAVRREIQSTQFKGANHV